MRASRSFFPRLALILRLIFSLLDRAEECLGPQRGAGESCSPSMAVGIEAVALPGPSKRRGCCPADSPAQEEEEGFTHGAARPACAVGGDEGWLYAEKLNALL